MKAWKTAVQVMRCGYDYGHEIAVGDGYFELEDNTGKKRVRCSKCAVRHETSALSSPDPVEPPTSNLQPPTSNPQPLVAVSELEIEPEGEPW